MRALVSRSCLQISQAIGPVRRSYAKGVPVHGPIIFVILLLSLCIVSVGVDRHSNATRICLVIYKLRAASDQGRISQAQF